METVKAIAFWAFVIAFAIKVPVWPFHTWLPDAHTEAPTAGSMILAGVMLKLALTDLSPGSALFPAESAHYAIWLAVLAAASIVFGGLAGGRSERLQRLVAYSSINHMGFVILGIAAAAWAMAARKQPSVRAASSPSTVQSCRCSTTGSALQNVLPGRGAVRACPYP